MKIKAALSLLGLLLVAVGAGCIHWPSGLIAGGILLYLDVKGIL